MRRIAQSVGGRTVLGYGHYGRPMLVFAGELGSAEEFEQKGMVDAVAELLEAGRVKLFCLDSDDAFSWSDRSIDLEERARRHGRFEWWVLNAVLPWVADQTGGAHEFGALGCSLGAFHAANLVLKRADLFPFGLCLSGNYDPTNWNAWGEAGEQTHVNNPMASLVDAGGEHLDWLRRRVYLHLVVGRGQWETTPTGALPGTLAFADLLQARGIGHRLDVWGEDTPHDWPSWRAQLAQYLPGYC